MTGMVAAAATLPTIACGISRRGGGSLFKDAVRLLIVCVLCTKKKGSQGNRYIRASYLQPLRIGFL